MKDSPRDSVDLRNLTSFKDTIRDTAEGRADVERNYESVLASVRLEVWHG